MELLNKILVLGPLTSEILFQSVKRGLWNVCFLRGTADNSEILRLYFKNIAVYGSSIMKIVSVSYLIILRTSLKSFQRSSCLKHCLPNVKCAVLNYRTLLEKAHFVLSK